jgi:hypothetical protein
MFCIEPNQPQSPDSAKTPHNRTSFSDHRWIVLVDYGRGVELTSAGDEDDSVLFKQKAKTNNIDVYGSGVASARGLEIKIQDHAFLVFYY